MSGMPSVSSVLRDPVIAVWAVLSCATVASFLLGVEGSPGDHRFVSSVIILIAVFKVRLVGLYFMEVRDAPSRLRVPFECYCVAACLVLLGLFLIT